MHSARPCNRQRGTTFIELMMGVVLALTILGGAVTMVASNSKLRRTDEEQLAAFRACRDKIEELRSLDFAQLLAQHDADFVVDGPGKKLAAVPGDADGRPGEVSVVEHEKVGSEIIYRVTVTVTWTGLSPRRSYSMSCLMADRRRRK
jgi:hypothetical protein